MASAQPTLPTTQSALQWVRVSKTNPFEWTTSAPVIKPSELGDNQVLIQNYAVSLNPLDYKMGAYNFSNTQLPAVTGYDVSGRIVAVGKGVKDFKVGDEVFGLLNANSSNGGGALQQYSVADADILAKKPAGVSHADAATLGVAYLSAMDGFRQVKIDSSTTVFIPGGSGGVGHFTVQLAQILGAKQVIASASKDEGIAILKEQYHVKDVINYAKENVVDRVLELSGGKGVDIVYDSTYLESSFEKSIKTVKEGGSWIVLGHFAKEGSEAAKSVAQRKAKLVHADLGRYWLGPEQGHLRKTVDGLLEQGELRKTVRGLLEQGAQWVAEGKLKPYISQTIKLEQAENALKQIESGKGGFGKIVVKLL